MKTSERSVSKKAGPSKSLSHHDLLEAEPFCISSVF